MEIGHTYKLKVSREVDFGVYMESEKGEILLPSKYVPENTKPGDIISVFIHRDSEDRLLATTLKPAGEVGDIVVLRVKDITRHGAFMDWGLEKDLFVPRAEQHVPFSEGMRVPVRIAVDYSTDRLLGTSKLQSFLSKNPAETLSEGEEVSLIVYDETDLGIKMLVNKTCSGLLFSSDVFGHMEIGDQMTGYVKNIREDGKIDLTLRKEGLEGIKQSRSELEELLLSHDGYLPLNDKSTPEEIRRLAGMSKKAFKKALGGLYKARKVKMEENGIRLLS